MADSFPCYSSRGKKSATKPHARGSTTSKLNPVPPNLCHMISYHGNKKYSTLGGMGLRMLVCYINFKTKMIFFIYGRLKSIIYHKIHQLQFFYNTKNVMVMFNLINKRHVVDVVIVSIMAKSYFLQKILNQ